MQQITTIILQAHELGQARTKCVGVEHVSWQPTLS